MTTGAAAPSATIVVYMYNSSAVIAETLRAIAGLQVPAGMAPDLLLIDNRSSDGCGQFALREWDSLGAPFPGAVVREERPGLISARCRAYRVARGDIIVNCDDDNSLAPDYLRLAMAAFADPAVGLVGGSNTIHDDGSLPGWFAGAAPFFACQSFAPGTVVEGITRRIPGAGLCVRREVARLFLDVDIPRLSRNRSGGRLWDGNDAEVCLRGYRAGYRGVTIGDMRLRHRIHRSRLSLAYALRLVFDMGIASAGLHVYDVEVCRRSGFSPLHFPASLSWAIHLARGLAAGRRGGWAALFYLVFELGQWEGCSSRGRRYRWIHRTFHRRRARLRCRGGRAGLSGR